MTSTHVLSDARVLANLLFRSTRGRTHAQRLSSFYHGQAADYDRFRERLLPGRRELVRRLPAEPGMRWVDMGGGTASTLEYLGARAASLKKYQVVDLCPPLLEQARRRIARLRLDNAEGIEADVTRFEPTEGPVDVVLFSYSLSMIPDWFRAIDHAEKLLRPGGFVGVVDFYVSRRFPERGLRRHSAFSRTFWPLWFSWDGIHLNRDLLPYLRNRFAQVSLEERTTRLPYVPASNVPYFLFLGRKSPAAPSPRGISARPPEHERRHGQAGRENEKPPQGSPGPGAEGTTTRLP